jgi:hypothetical protein
MSKSNDVEKKKVCEKHFLIKENFPKTQFTLGLLFNPKILSLLSFDIFYPKIMKTILKLIFHNWKTSNI